MIAQPPSSMICFPPAALNGGPLESAPAKVGEWVWQPKVDGWRGVVHAPTMKLWSQYGELSSITDKFQVALHWLRVLHSEESQYEWLDVELMNNRHAMMRGSIIVLDLIVAGMEFSSRRKRLEQMLAPLPFASELVGKRAANDEVYLINQGTPQVNPLAYYQHLRVDNDAIGAQFYEGLVAKRAASLYCFGRKPKQITSDWIKHRWP